MSGTRQNNDKFRSEKPDDEPETDWTALKALHSDLYHDLSDLNRQVRMISESLAACKKISRRRQLNGHHSKPPGNPPNSEKVARRTLDPQWNPQTPAQIILPPEERTQVFTGENDPPTIVSYMVENHPPLDFLEPFLPSNLRGDDGTVRLWTDGWLDHSTVDDEVDCRKRASIEWTQETERMNSMKLVQLIQKELRKLMEIVPSASPIIVQLSDILFHYKECPRCSKKSHGFYPSVLARIQNLTEFAGRRREEGNQVQSGPVRKGTDKSWPAASKEKNSRKEENRSKTVQIGRLKKVDATAVANDKPGFQVQLFVKPEKGNKRFFERLKRTNIGHNLQAAARGNNQVVSVVDLHETDYNLNLNVLRTCSRPRIHWQRKREIIPARAFALALTSFHLLPEPEIFDVSVLLSRELLSFLEVVRTETYLKQTPHHEEFFLVRASKFAYNQVRKTCLSPVKPSQNEIEPVENFQDSEETLADLMREFIEEAKKEDTMNLQKVNDLEEEVKTLKDLMMEVHKNQIELSKILLEKGIYSQPIMKLTDPKVLEEETEAVKRASLLETPPRTSSTESLQIAVDELKKKCAIKNRMIVALLKGLRSNVPKEWWEELVDCIFNESKPIEEFDTERVNEFIRQTSLYLIKGEEASTGKRAPSPSSSRPGTLPLSLPVQNSASEEEARGEAGVCLGGGNEFDREERDWWPSEEKVTPGECATESSESKESYLGHLPERVAFLSLENERLWREIDHLKRQLHQWESEERGRVRCPKEVDGEPETIQKRKISFIIQIGDKEKRKFDVGKTGRRPTGYWVVRSDRGTETLQERECGTWKRKPERETTALRQLDSPREEKAGSLTATFLTRKPEWTDLPIGVRCRFCRRSGMCPGMEENSIPLAGPSSSVGGQFSTARFDELLKNGRRLQTIPENDLDLEHLEGEEGDSEESGVLLLRLLESDLNDAERK